MPVQVGDALNLAITLNGTAWQETVLDVRTGQSVAYQKDLLGQAQAYAYFQIEGYGQNPAAPTVFTNTSVTFASGRASCSVFHNGDPDSDDLISSPTVAGDGRTCQIANITLYAPGRPIAARTTTSRSRYSLPIPITRLPPHR